jgi:hypothetical protein
LRRLNSSKTIYVVYYESIGTLKFRFSILSRYLQRWPPVFAFIQIDAVAHDYKVLFTTDIMNVVKQTREPGMISEV